jgi:dephospho-CoA kinase
VTDFSQTTITQLQLLNGIMFPATEAQVKEEVARLGKQGHRWVVVEAALLLEAQWEKWMDEVWCMVVSPDVARQRVVDRNGLSAAAAEQRIQSQMPNAERAARASMVIDSSGPKGETAAELEEAVAALQRRVRVEYGFDLVVGEHSQ